jgi:hypothetical protein
MDFIPWTSFDRLVAKYGGDIRVRKLRCTEQFRAMAFAQMTYRESELRIKHFYGTSENAVKTQIWIAVSVYVLAAIIKKALRLDLSLYTFLQILSVRPFEKIELLCAFQDLDHSSPIPISSNQLNLFEN